MKNLMEELLLQFIFFIPFIACIVGPNLGEVLAIDVMLVFLRIIFEPIRRRYQIPEAKA
jgi:hypothetical protein